VYYSATFTPTESHYDIYNRELLAIMKALSTLATISGMDKGPIHHHDGPHKLTTLEVTSELGAMSGMLACGPARI
jgi:hypothetical protein